MDSYGFKRIKIGSDGFKWVWVGSDGIYWIQMDSNGFHGATCIFDAFILADIEGRLREWIDIFLEGYCCEIFDFD